MSGTAHRAFVEQTDGGGWLGGCRRCRTSFIEADEGRAHAWVSGHDSAVACQRDVARREDPTFAPTGPNEAMPIHGLRELADTLGAWFGDAEVLMPADRAPLLYVFTPPTEEGWHRDLLAIVHVDTGEIEVPPRADVIAGADAVTPR